MKKIYKNSSLKDINKYTLTIGIVFIVFVIIGSYLNKIWPSYQNTLLEGVNSIVKYYDLGIITKEIVISNLKSDLIFMISIAILVGFVVTSPIAMIIFMLKGLSIGYTINSTILVLKFESIKFILITLTKNFIIIPGTVIMIIISVRYLYEAINEYKKNKRKSIIFLVKRYFQNVSILIFITITLQFIVNVVSVGITKFLV